MFLFGKKYLRDQKIGLPDFIKAEIMNKTNRPWFEPESTDQLPSPHTLWGNLKHIRRRLILDHLAKVDERLIKSSIPRDRRLRIRSQVIRAQLTAYQDADSIAGFYKKAQAYSEEIRDLF